MDNRQTIRPHMTKDQRLPKCFKEVEKILRSVKSCQMNYKTVLANSRLRGYNHKKVYSMTVNVLKNYNYIQKIIDKVQLLEKEKYLRREIASILIHELIFGHGFLPGESKVVKTIQLYENDIFHAHEVLHNKHEGSLSIEINIPRYVRVHTLVTTVPYVIKDLASYGFNQVVYDNDLSEEEYLELVKNLNKGSFLIDFHFKDVLVFERYENLVSLDLYKNGHIFLQDKSSYIPVHVLNPEPGCAVLDACAAPGMKTVHIAAKMKNKGILIACERDKSRFECLKEMLDCGSVKICKTLCKDFKLIDPSDQAYSTVEYILLDPSCSGSGMVNRLDEVTDTENSKNIERLSKLAGFQIILLKHSLKFPSVKRVVYSTCSIHEEENEFVVHEALKAFNGTFKLTSAMPEWSHRGSEKFEFGKLCLRTDPKVHLSNGFFVAVFERIVYDEYVKECFSNKQQNYQIHDGSSFKKQKKKSKLISANCHEKETVDDYAIMNLKNECNISHPLETHQMNDSKQIPLINKDDESVENAIQNLKQNSVYTQQISKKHKKKKKLDECLYESNELNSEFPDKSALKSSKLKKYSNISFSKNNDNGNASMKKDKSEQNDYLSEKNLYDNVEIVKELTDVTEFHKKKKKKKKKKDHFETAMLEPTEKHLLESGEQNQDQSNTFEQKYKIPKLKTNDNILQPDLEDDSSAFFTSKDISAQNKHIKNMRHEDSAELINMISSHKKKKKKKKHLDIDSIQSHETQISQSEKCLSKLNDLQNMILKPQHKPPKLKESIFTTSPSCAISDNINKYQNTGSISENNKISEECIDSSILHKKKKKKKKLKEHC